jgi:hypothetical protein
LIGLRILNVNFDNGYGTVGLMTQPPTLSDSSSKPCLALALPAAGLLLAALLSSSMHRRPLTWKKIMPSRRKYQGGVLNLGITNLACMHITGITCHISNNYRESKIKDKVPNNTDIPKVES